jgi:tetratricopeptide (TPR) repeat protein
VKQWLRLGLVCIACAQATAVAAQAPSVAEEAAYSDTMKRAVTAYDRGDLATAARLFELAHQLVPNARSERAVGLTWYKLRDYAQAIPWLMRALDDTRRPLTQRQRREVTALLADAQRRACID